MNVEKLFRVHGTIKTSVSDQVCFEQDVPFYRRQNIGRFQQVEAATFGTIQFREYFRKWNILVCRGEIDRSAFGRGGRNVFLEVETVKIAARTFYLIGSVRRAFVRTRVHIFVYRQSVFATDATNHMVHIKTHTANEYQRTQNSGRYVFQQIHAYKDKQLRHPRLF